MVLEGVQAICPQRTSQSVQEFSQTLGLTWVHFTDPEPASTQNQDWDGEIKEVRDSISTSGLAQILALVLVQPSTHFHSSSPPLLQPSSPTPTSSPNQNQHQNNQNGNVSPSPPPSNSAHFSAP